MSKHRRGLAAALALAFLFPLSAAASEPVSPGQVAAARTIARVWMAEGYLHTAQALAVSWFESRWISGAENPICCASGLFQITKGTWENHHSQQDPGGGAGWGGERRAQLEPEANARMAHFIWEESGKSWHRWSVANEDVDPGRQKRVDVADPLGSLPPPARAAALSLIEEEMARRRGLGYAGPPPEAPQTPTRGGEVRYLMWRSPSADERATPPAGDERRPLSLSTPWRCPFPPPPIFP